MAGNKGVTIMSGRSEKKKRRAIRKFVEENRDIVLHEVLQSMRQAPLKKKLAFMFIIFFRRG